MSLTKKQASIKKKWLNALRSGKYKQGQETLYNPTTKSFCCLGVLEHCVLDGSVENVWNPDVLDGATPSERRKLKKEFASMPSPTFYAAHDLDWVKDNEARLAGYNDSGSLQSGWIPYDFNKIADFIDKEWT